MFRFLKLCLKGQVWRVLVVGFVACSLMSCAKSLTGVPIEEEDKLFTSGMFRSLEQYHVILEDPSIQQLEHPGFIVGVEKSPRASILFPAQASESKVVYDASRLRFPAERMGATSADDIERQRTHFESTFDDFKVMYVSHLVEFASDARGDPTRPRLLFSAYETTGFESLAGDCNIAEQSGSYEQGWDAIGCLRDRVFETLHEAQKGGSPHSHVLVMVMGWNTSQERAIENYNRIVRNTKIAAGEDGSDFNPLTIGITWPSVWGGSPELAVLNLPLHLLSYSARARDADELGTGIANEIINGLGVEVESAFNIPTIAIGHSFGARALSRTLYSSDYRTSFSDQTETEGPLVIGLQPAFSAGRFQAEEAPWFPLVPAEGGPYQQQERASGRLIVTWSEHDAANRLAQVVTGAKHVGGQPGHDLAREIHDDEGDQSRFVFLNSPLSSNHKRRCGAAIDSNKIVYVDATTTIGAHGDIGNLDDGQLIWDLISCSGY